MSQIKKIDIEQKILKTAKAIFIKRGFLKAVFEISRNAESVDPAILLLPIIQIKTLYLSLYSNRY